jgi:low temperature requirement protein LtrA
MNDATIKLIEDMAMKLGTTVEHLWGVLVSQAVVSSVTRLGIFFILGFVCYLLFKHLFVRHTLKDYDDDEKMTLIAIRIGFGVAVIGVFVAAILIIPTIVTGFVNPEYWALERIVNRRCW